MFGAYIFIILSLVIMILQIALALGAPLGEYTLGGQYKGKLPKKLRIAAIFQIVILALFVMIVTSRATIAFDFMFSFSKIAIWFVCAFFVLGTLMNFSSKSPKEKWTMGPLNVIALISVLLVAFS
jgi:hypothetical protein